MVEDVDFVPLASIKGHDSFLADMDAFRPVICRYFESCDAERTMAV